MAPLQLQVQNLSKTYPKSKKPALNSISFEVFSGDIFGLLGPNGAGKTTTLSLLSGWLAYKQGSIRYKGLELKRQRRSIQKTIGFVPQDIALYPSLTAKENLYYFGRLYGFKGNQLKRRIGEQLERLGLEAHAHKRLDTFSSGMKRRTNLIAGMLHQPQILFLDEPTVGIDVQSRAVIVEYLKTLNRQGTTIVYSSHDLDEAERLCKNVAILDHGKILILGETRELLKSHKEVANLQDLFLQLTGRELRD